MEDRKKLPIDFLPHRGYIMNNAYQISEDRETSTFQRASSQTASRTRRISAGGGRASGYQSVGLDARASYKGRQKGNIGSKEAFKSYSLTSALGLLSSVDGKPPLANRLKIIMTELSDAIKENLTLKKVEDDKFQRIVNEEKCAFLCMVAPYRAVRISPIEEIRALIGLHEEFAIETAIDEIKTMGNHNNKLIILLNSLGGGMHSSYKVARALRTSFDEIEVFVPHLAASGGTLIALASNKIVMGQMSQLSPLDPQTIYKGTRISTNNFRKAYDRLCKLFETTLPEEAPYPQKILAEKFDPFVTEQWNAQMNVAIAYIREILSLSKYTDEQSIRIANILVKGFESHDEVINYDVAKKVGINVARHTDNKRYRKIWGYMKYWLGRLLITESTTHIFEYATPKMQRTKPPGKGSPKAKGGGRRGKRG